MKENKLSGVPESDRFPCLCCRGKVTCSPVCGCRVSSSVPSSPSSLFVEETPTQYLDWKKSSFCLLFPGQSLKCPSFSLMWPQADMLFSVCQEWLNTPLWPLAPFQPLPSPLVAVASPTWPCTEAKRFPRPLWLQKSRWEQRGRSRQLVAVTSSCYWNKICWYFYTTNVSFWYEECRADQATALSIPVFCVQHWLLADAWGGL